MLKIFYGEERTQAQQAINKLLGSDYELVEAENLKPEDLPSLFFGTSLFGESRSILIKDLDANSDCWAEILKYLDTPHKVIIWNEKAPDGRSELGKNLKTNKQVELKGFEREVSKTEQFAAFNLYDDAVSGRTKKALAMVAEMQLDKNKDPYSTVGALTSKALTALERRDRKAPAILKILAQVDMEMKSTGLDGWILVKKAIVEMGMVK